ncbi:uncharacterized protein J8A68_000367 [[Candida] subhashii]|uniref:ubiquitinyl hydrolase 1 n=1 Tax=[Candida] subhashii TaxID=561895 RepID=A0A8J5QJY8_9ASCO|nr:uncharacterized protein J8A68_000367 [[Candida] subhashii]KAG7666111.1 hypothetical protein J8A68_000367 [[Candida] subhashii]
MSQDIDRILQQPQQEQQPQENEEVEEIIEETPTVGEKDEEEEEQEEDDDDDEEEEEDEGEETPEAVQQQTQEDVDEQLIENRQLINELLTKNTGKEGDEFYLISRDYLNSFFNLQVNDFQQLIHELGPIDCTKLIDEQSGQLYPENDEPIATYNVSPIIFQYLSQWFGIYGIPVSRCLIINPETGTKEVERFPPSFIVHQIVTKRQNTHTSSYFRSGGNRHHHNTSYHGSNDTPIPVMLSRTRTFYDLLEIIRINVLKTPKKSITDFRIWFIDSNADLSFNITPNTFIFDINQKRLVNQGILQDTLKSQGIDAITYQIVVEIKEKHGFPIDQFVSTHLKSYSEENETATGAGHLGLTNLGNTCYMNSALQCLLHVPEINHYFYYNIYKKELNPNNPLGYHGDVANSFGSLLKQAFDINASKSSSSITPREFKSTIGRYSSMFSGYLQQDSQEFLSWLLDALHEDLNRIHEKPYCEKPELEDSQINDPNAIIKLSETCWQQHQARNDSVITDLFTGLYQSTLVCPDCSKTSITFDPFNDLTLPLPISKKWYHTFTIVDLSPEKIMPQRIMKLEVELNKNSNYDELLNYLSKFLNIPSSFLFIFELFQGSFYSDFQLDYLKNKFLPIGDIIRDNDDIYVYCIPHDLDQDIIVPVFNSVQQDSSGKSYRGVNMFGIPLFVVLNKEEDGDSFGNIRRKLLSINAALTEVDLVSEYENIKSNMENYIDKEYYTKRDFPMIENEVEDEEGYDSDVSLANPYIGGNFGFTINYVHEYTPKMAMNFRSRFTYGHHNKHAKQQQQQPERVINAPMHKPSIQEFKPLGEQLSDVKRDYYHYPDYCQQKLDQEMEELIVEEDGKTSDVPVAEEFTSANVSEETSEESYVMVEGTTTSEEQIQQEHREEVIPPPLPPRGRTIPVSSDEDETESEVNLGTLFDSTSNLPPPPPSTYSVSSTKPSNVNSPVEQEPEESPEVGQKKPLVTKDTILLCDWDPEIFQKCFDISQQTWHTIPNLSNPELEKNKAILERQRKAKISVYDCVKCFSTPEILGEHDLWYCPTCKDHKRATKTIQLWSTGDILTIHLKRFHSARAFSDKIDMLVDFPIEGLDMSSYIANPVAATHPENNLYDLIAVDNHYGGIGGGHYTATVRNFRDGEWYLFNDSRVTKTASVSEIVTPAAYLLFYRRRSSESGNLGGSRLNELIEGGRKEYHAGLMEKKAKVMDVDAQLGTYYEIEKRLIEQMELDNEIQLQKEKLAQEGEEEVEVELEGGEAGRSAGAEFNLVEEEDYDYEEEDEAEDDEELQVVKMEEPESQEEEVVIYEEDDEEDGNDNIRKQRLISKENNSNLLVQIKSNGKTEITSSPIQADLESDVESSGGSTNNNNNVFGGSQI